MRFAKRAYTFALAVVVLMSAAPAMAADGDFLPDVSWPAPIYHMKGMRGVDTNDYGDVYVADTDNHRVLKFGRFGGVSVWGKLGTADGQFNKPMGIAVSPNNLYVYVADTMNHRIQKFDANGKHLETWGRLGGEDRYGNGPKEFNEPKALTVDTDGNVYVCDSGNERVQKFDKNGVYQITEWGDPGSTDGQFLDPRGIDVRESDNHIFVADYDYTNPRIQEFRPTGGFERAWPMPPLISGQRGDWGLTVASTGDVYVVDENCLNGQVTRFDREGLVLGVFGYFNFGDVTPQGEPAMVRPTGITTVMKDGQEILLVCDTLNDRLREFSLTGEPLNIRGSWGNGPARFFQPSGVDVDDLGNIYTTSQSKDAKIEGYRIQHNHRVAKFSPTFELRSWSPTLTPALANYDNRKFSQPAAISVDASRHAYVTEVGVANTRIQKLDGNYDLWYMTKWGELGTATNRFNAPGGIATGVINGIIQVFVADTNNNRVLVFNRTGGWAIRNWGSYGTGNGYFKYPQGIAFAPDGKIYVADTGNHRIQYFSSTGQYLGKWGGYGNDATHFNSPYGVGVAPNGDVYVSDTNNHRIKKFTWNGVPLDSYGRFGHDPGQFWNPHGISVGPDNRVYVADYNNHRIQVFKPRNPSTVTVTVTPSRTLYQGSVAVSGTLTAENGQPYPAAKTMKLYRSYDGVNWTLLKTQESTTGVYWHNTTIDRMSIFRWVYEGDQNSASAENRASAISKAKIGNPVAPARAYKGRSTKVYGYMWPKHPRGTWAVNLQAERWNGTRYVPKFSRNVTVTDYYSSSKYSGYLKFPYTGRWRVRAVHKDAGHLPSNSVNYDYLTVK